LDLNGDVSLSQEEIKRAKAKRQSGGFFKRLDHNQDGVIDEAEFAAFEKHRLKKRLYKQGWFGKNKPAD